MHTFTARLDNVTNELYRNHLSYIKDEVPEMGRNFKVVYAVKFDVPWPAPAALAAAGAARTTGDPRVV